MGKIAIIVTAVISLLVGKVAYDIFSDAQVPKKLLAQNYSEKFNHYIKNMHNVNNTE